MSNLSWLNPTPHAIAVYASQPLSPTLATKQDATPYLGRTFTGWIAPACGWRTYSITSSAVLSRVDGTVRPRALAVLRLRTNSNFVGCITGISAGFAPLRIWPTYSPAWRYIQLMLGP